jgi:hypothetical protein
MAVLAVLEVITSDGEMERTSENTSANTSDSTADNTSDGTSEKGEFLCIGNLLQS